MELPAKENVNKYLYICHKQHLKNSSMQECTLVT